ncbi:MAG: hypothetical protein ING44_20340 [Telmatospirillum sp.]|nr:hypothetical protein [Telmatospirillum sp.]
MTPLARPAIDYAAHVKKARMLRTKAFAAALADLRRWLLAPLRTVGWMREARTR